MHNKWFSKLQASSKQWFQVVWFHIRTHKAFSLTLVTIVLLVVLILVFSTKFKALWVYLWSWMCGNPELTAGFLTCLILAIGLYFAYKQFKLIKITEQAQLIQSMSVYWNSQVMRKSRKALWEMRKTNATTLCDELKKCEEQDDFERRLELTTVGDFFEEMGNLAHQKALDLTIIAGYFRSPILNYYTHYELLIKENRPTQPTIYEHFEWLAKNITKVKATRIQKGKSQSEG